MSILFTTPLGMRIDEGLGGTPADLAVRIFGPDLDTLTALGDQAKAIVSRVEGPADLRAERMTGLPQLRIDVDREAAARVGLTPGDVIDAVRIGMAGEQASTVRIGQRNYDLIVRLQDDARNDVQANRLTADRRSRWLAHSAQSARYDRENIRPGRDSARGRKPSDRCGGKRRRA